MTQSKQIESLKELLTISKSQQVLVRNGRLDDALRYQERRDDLVEGLKRDYFRLTPGDKLAEGLVREIMENDEKLRLLITVELNNISSKLRKRMEAKKVITAYKKRAGTG